MWVSPRQLALAGDFTVCHIRSEVEGDGRCAAEGGHVVGGNNVAAFDAERKNSLRGDHRHDVDAARNGVGKFMKPLMEVVFDMVFLLSLCPVILPCNRAGGLVFGGGLFPADNM